MKFYYQQDQELTELELNEYAKIGLVFLENSIELLLKAIISVDDPLCIYKEPNSKRISKALEQVTETNRLEDILIEDANFQTISYTEAVNLYVNKYNAPEKVYNILTELGYKRNAITHFGIDETDNYSELVACFINTYDVIYNYLYPNLLDLNNVGHYFSDDDMYIMSNIGKIKYLIDFETGRYNNIIDFLDMLLEDSYGYIFNQRMNNSHFNISFFSDIFAQLIDDNSLNIWLKKQKIKLCCEDFLNFATSTFKTIDIYLNGDEEPISIIWNYSVYYDHSFFFDEFSNMIFSVDHKTNKIYYYNKSIKYESRYDKKEVEFNFIEDVANEKCEELNVSKRNLRKILIEQMTSLQKEYGG